jgi:4-hydroxybenzoate polyprenyltransferase
MRIALRILDLVLYTSLFTACCALGLCMATERLISNTAPPVISYLHMLVLGSTLVVYNAPRILLKRRKLPLHKAWYYFFFSSGFVLMVASLFTLSWQIVLLAVALGLLAFAYTLPLLPFENTKRLREIGWIKITVLAGVWTIATSILPIIYLNKHISDYPFEILLRFVFIFTLCVIFDIRDMQKDLKNNILTLPHKMGIRNSYRLINITLVLFLFLSVLQFYKYHHAGRLAGALLTSVATWLVVLYLRRRPSERAYLLLADGVMLLYAGLVLIH